MQRKRKGPQGQAIGGNGTRRNQFKDAHPSAGIAAKSVAVRGDCEVKSYAECAAFFIKYAKPGTSAAKLGSNLLLVRKHSDHAPGVYTVRLYETDILTYYADGTFSAQHGGWNTPTTTARLNQFGPRRCHFAMVERRLTVNGRAILPDERLTVERAS